MDREGNTAEDLEPTLRDLRNVNRLLGGRAALLRALRPRIEAAAEGATVRILDVGTGDGDLPRAIVAEATRLGRRAEIVAIDRDPVVATLARAGCAGIEGIHVVRADALRLPFADRAFDIVTASLFLHHFEDRDAVRVLRELRRVARNAVVVNDLRRHRLAWAFIWLLGKLRMVSPMSANDGPLSVLKGFTAAELLVIGRAAGGDGTSVRRLWPYRLLLEVPGR
jgi:ubiquinone/menaquinone biosynthesis C-methylase UbiE